MITQNEINEIVMRIAEKFDPEKIILFGSNVTGKANKDNDLDLIIVKQSNLPKHKRGIEIRRLFYRMLIPMDLKIYTPEEFNNELKNDYSFLNMALKESRVVYEHKG
jgi:uncharacterized protein